MYSIHASTILRIQDTRYMQKDHDDMLLAVVATGRR